MVYMAYGAYVDMGFLSFELPSSGTDSEGAVAGGGEGGGWGSGSEGGEERRGKDGFWGEFGGGFEGESRGGGRGCGGCVMGVDEVCGGESGC